MDENLKELRFNSEKAEKFFTKQMAYTLGPMELKSMIDDNKNIVILDVRDKEDFDEAHVPNAVSMPRKEMDTRYEELSKDNLHIVYCYNQQCHLGLCACRFLATKGIPCMHMDGGFKSWSDDFRFSTMK